MLVIGSIVVVFLLGVLAYRYFFADFGEALSDVRSLDAGMKKEAELLATGEPAKATVLKIENTGMKVNDNPAVLLGLKVQREDREPYTVVVSTVVDIVALPRVQPGCIVDVRVRRDDPKEVAIAL